MTMKHIDVLRLCECVRDRESGAFVDRMTSAQEPGGVIEHDTVHAARNVGTIYWIGEDVKVQW